MGFDGDWEQFIKDNPDRVREQSGDRKVEHDLPKRRSKYDSKPKHRDGFRFDSILEADYYEHLKLLQKNGDILFFLRQVPLHLPGGSILRVDFVVFWADGTVTFEDTKGYVTQVFKTKKREAEAHYPIRIDVIKREDFSFGT